MSLLDRVREAIGGAGRSRGDSGATDALIAEALEDIGRTVPKAMAAPGARRKLRDAVAGVLAYASSLVDDLGEPVSMGVDAVASDPLIGSFFSSAGEARSFLAGRHGPSQALSSPGGPCGANEESGSEVYFLLTMTRHEKTTLASVRDGNMIRSGVERVSESFLDHAAVAASSSLPETRCRLVLVILHHLATKAAENIDSIKEALAEGDRAREMLKAEIDGLKLEGRGKERFSPERLELDRQIGVLDAERKGVEEKLAALRPKLDDLSGYLEQVREVLLHARDYLRLEKVSMRLDEFGIKVDPTDDSGRAVTFIEARGREDSRVVLLARIGREELMELSGGRPEA